MGTELATAGETAREPSLVDSLLRYRATLPEADPARETLRHKAIEASASMARSLARRYAGRGEPLADLEQVALVGLLKAVDGFDPKYCSDFWAYAAPTVRGEIKRYFRDKSWAAQVPRRYKNLHQELRRCRDELVQRLRRQPRTVDYADHLGASQAEIAQAFVAANAHSSASLSTGPDSPLAALCDRIGDFDPGYELIDVTESVHGALARLSRREQRIVTLRYFGNMTQSEIAAEVGISQMHVSRLLARSLRELRECLTEP